MNTKPKTMTTAYCLHLPQAVREAADARAQELRLSLRAYIQGLIEQDTARPCSATS